MLHTSRKTGTDGSNSCLPPLLGVLFCPTRMRMHQWIIDKSPGYYTPICGCEKGSLDTSGSEINAQQCLHNRAPLIAYVVK
jgi:hypothetical protein